MPQPGFLKLLVSAVLLIPVTPVFASPVLTKPNTMAREFEANKAPAITITRVPQRGGGPNQMATIAGNVTGVILKECKVVVFARTNTWYVQPYIASPYTSIGVSGKWQTQTHLGDEYAALLVVASYKPPATTDSLPEVGGLVLASISIGANARRDATSASSSLNPSGKRNKPIRVIRFSGYAWKVKTSDGPVGPGPNYFSDNNENVRIDKLGRLHLRVTHRDGHWYCAEVVSMRSFGYGTYKFYLDTEVDDLDASVVLGMFTWSDDPAYSHREIDVEISRWGDVHNPNAQFVVQPYTQQSNILRFELPRAVKRTVHSFEWRRDSVLCQSVESYLRSGSQAQFPIQNHVFTRDIPRSGGENARINLWLMNGEARTRNGETEVIIGRFEFLPENRGPNALHGVSLNNRRGS